MTRYDDADTDHLTDALVALMESHPSVGRIGKSYFISNTVPVIPMYTDRWTVSLERQQAAPVTFRPTSAQVRDRPNHDAIAAELASSFLEVQDLRHRTALAHGVAPLPGCALQVDAFAIDRATAQLLRRSGNFSPESLLEQHRSADVSISSLITVTLCDGDPAPILACELPVGDGTPPARILGNVLSVDVSLPGTLLVASEGRPLGDVIATGLAMLDERRIVSAAATETGVDFTLATDVVTVAEARLAGA